MVTGSYPHDFRADGASLEVPRRKSRGRSLLGPAWIVPLIFVKLFKNLETSRPFTPKENFPRIRRSPIEPQDNVPTGEMSHG